MLSDLAKKELIKYYAVGTLKKIRIHFTLVSSLAIFYFTQPVF